MGFGAAAVFKIDHLLRPVRPVGDDGCIDGSCIAAHLAPDAGGISLFCFSFLKLQSEMTVGIVGHCHYEHARRVHVQPMHDGGRWILFLDPCFEAVGVGGGFAWHRQEPRRF